tara:strand:+ start:1219 stop:1758 length:540 start_codon:yes stop_codon:yes gene_type:complete
MSKIEVNQVDPSTGTTLTLGTSGDTITIPSGVTIANSGTATGFGGTNTPAFNVYGAAASVSNNTYTKLGVSTERFDVGSCFDLGSNNRFTPNVSGKYLLYLKAEIQSGNDTDYFVGNIYKNGSSGQAGAMVQRDYNIMTFMQLAEANGSGDYFEAYAKQQSGGSVNIVLLEFSGFKIIE